MIINSLVVGLLQTNCYIIADPGSQEGAIIDPGGDAARIMDATKEWTISYVINTHNHFDHIQSNQEILESLRQHQGQAPTLIAHPDVEPTMAADGGARMFGFKSVPSVAPDRLVQGGDTLEIGRTSLQVLHTPGHSPDSISLYCAAEQTVFVGDVLFQSGVGRVDLPGGDWSTLLNSINGCLFALPDDTIVYPGHGPATTIGKEKRNNPFLQ